MGMSIVASSRLVSAIFYIVIQYNCVSFLEQSGNFGGEWVVNKLLQARGSPFIVEEPPLPIRASSGRIYRKSAWH